MRFSFSTFTFELLLLFSLSQSRGVIDIGLICSGNYQCLQASIQPQKISPYASIFLSPLLLHNTYYQICIIFVFGKYCAWKRSQNVSFGQFLHCTKHYSPIKVSNDNKIVFKFDQLSNFLLQASNWAKNAFKGSPQPIGQVIQVDSNNFWALAWPH